MNTCLSFLSSFLKPLEVPLTEGVQLINCLPIHVHFSYSFLHSLLIDLFVWDPLIRDEFPRPYFLVSTSSMLLRKLGQAVTEMRKARCLHLLKVCVETDTSRRYG